MRSFCYNSDDKRRLGKPRIERRLKRALEQTNTFFFPGPRIHCRPSSPSLPVSTAVRVISSSPWWRLYLLILKTHETCDVVHPHALSKTVAYSCPGSAHYCLCFFLGVSAEVNFFSTPGPPGRVGAEERAKEALKGHRA